jgi:hypothetical protein
MPNANTYAIAAVKRYYAARRRVCEACVRAGDLRFGRSYRETTCSRCGAAIWTSLIVEELKAVI